MAINKINRVVLHEDVKNELDNKATKQELQSTKEELENVMNEIYQGIVWKPTVPTFDDLRIVYPNAKDGWKSTVEDTNITYQYDLETDMWFATSINALPLATSKVDGLMAQEDKEKLDTVEKNAQKNLTPQQALEQIKIVDGKGSGLDTDLFQGRTPDSFADEEHDHDGLYYKKIEVDSFLNGKAPKEHVHSKKQIPDFPTSMTPEYTAIPSNADLNDYTNIGFYGTANSAVDNTILNKPDEVRGFTMIVSKRGGYTTQIVIDMGQVNPYMWIRSFSDNWGVWHKVPFEGDIPTKLSQLVKDINFDERYYTENETDNKLNTKVDKVASKVLSDENYTLVEKNKLKDIATGATKNDTDANLKNRANHTGTQLSSTISNFADTVRSTVLTGLSTATNSVITATDTVITALGKLQKQITDNLSMLTSHIGNKSNPHDVKKADVNLDNVQNYGIATQAEAETGTSNAKYVTPLRVKQAIDKFKIKKVSELENDKKYVTSAELGNAGYGDMMKSTYDKDGDGIVDRAKIADSINWNGITEKPSTFTPKTHEHNIQDLQYKTIDFYVDGDAKTYYPVVISNISSLDDGQPSQKTLEIVRGHSWEAPDTWNTATHRGGLQIYLNTYVLGWGGMQYFMDITMGQLYSKMVADIIVPLPDTDTILIWLRGGHAKYRLIAYDKNIDITPYVGDFVNKPGTQYEKVYSPRIDIETAFNFTGLKKFNSIPEQFIGGGYRNIKTGNKVATINEMPTKLSELSNDTGKQLSTEDFTTAEKTKLRDMESGANKYTHPATHTVDMIVGLHSIAKSGNYNDLNSKPTKLSQFENDIKSYHKGSTPPANTNLLWLDTNS